jgi:aspartate kinase
VTSSDRRPIVVVKIGGSVLTGLPSYLRAAEFLRSELCARPGSRIVAVVSAEFGHTDVLAHEAQALDPAPDARMLDLLWSTGEIRSVALLTLALQQAHVQAAGLNAHQAGLRTLDDGGRIEFHLLPIRAALATHAVVVVPGFLATRRQALVTLGRGGSDLSAVLLARALGAAGCVLVKDVDGYFTADPAIDATATRIDTLTYTEAISKADEGCPLVQRQALDEGRRAGFPLVVRSVSGAGTVVTTQ